MCVWLIVINNTNFNYISYTEFIDVAKLFFVNIKNGISRSTGVKLFSVWNQIKDQLNGEKTSRGVVETTVWLTQVRNQTELLRDRITWNQNVFAYLLTSHSWRNLKNWRRSQRNDGMNFSFIEENKNSKSYFI